MNGLSSRLPGPGGRRLQEPENSADPEMMQQYVDYLILDPSPSSVHMQTPLLDPYNYQQVDITHMVNEVLDEILMGDKTCI